MVEQVPSTGHKIINNLLVVDPQIDLEYVTLVMDQTWLPDDMHRSWKIFELTNKDIWFDLIPMHADRVPP